MAYKIECINGHKLDLEPGDYLCKLHTVELTINDDGKLFYTLVTGLDCPVCINNLGRGGGELTIALPIQGGEED